MPPKDANCYDVQVKGIGKSELREVKLSHRIKALVVLNLQSYGGGRDVFGLRSSPEALDKKGFQTPIFNDGYLEVRLLQAQRVCPGMVTTAHHTEARCQRARSSSTPVVNGMHEPSKEGVDGM